MANAALADAGDPSWPGGTCARAGKVQPPVCIPEPTFTGGAAMHRVSLFVLVALALLGQSNDRQKVHG
jgi:hypothetical protein